MLNSQNTQASLEKQTPPDFTSFQRLAAAFLDDLDTDERLDTMIALHDFLAQFPATEQAESFMFFFRACCGFKSFEVEYNARRFARFAALSNCGGKDTLYGWERRATACHGRKGA